MMLPPVFATLKASAEIKAIVGSNPPRIYRHGAAPQYTDKPYISWLLVSGTPENNLSDRPPTDRQQIQIDAWHQTDSGVEVLARTIRDVIEDVAICTQVILDEQETETKLFRIALQFDWFYRPPQA